MNDWKCPDCSGPWLENFRFRHDPANCALRRDEDATQAADHERASWQGFTRSATSAELRLAEVIRGYPVYRAAQFHAAGEPASVGRRPLTVVTHLPGGLRKRIVHGVDPDAMAELHTNTTEGEQ